MNFWLIKCRKYLPDREGWSWDFYFDQQDPHDDHKWGGPDWIKSVQSKKHIREDVKKGDLIVCYQTEGRRICGFTLMVKDGPDAPHDDTIFIASAKNALWIRPEMTVEQLRETGCDPLYLRQGQGTIFPLSKAEFVGVVRAVRICCSGMEDDLDIWLKRTRFSEGWKASPREEEQDLKIPAGGAGFSTDRARNVEVEQAAVRLVDRYYRTLGWHVKDVSKDCLHYDLLCTKNGREAHVEVKGISGSLPNFPITRGEVREARTNDNFMLFVVVEALTRNARILQFTGSEFLSNFSLEPISYMATCDDNRKKTRA